jgi:hypothetical protein
MFLGQDVYQTLAALLTPHNPVLLVFLAVGLVQFLDLLPGDEH